MERLRNMREMFGIGVQDTGELAVVFEQGDPASSDPVDGRARPINVAAEIQLTVLDEPLYAPVEAVPGTVNPAELHELKQLIMAHEAGIAHLAQQRNVTFLADDQAAFGVSHDPFPSVQRRVFEQFQ